MVDDVYVIHVTILLGLESYDHNDVSIHNHSRTSYDLVIRNVDEVKPSNDSRRRARHDDTHS